MRSAHQTVGCKNLLGSDPPAPRRECAENDTKKDFLPARPSTHKFHGGLISEEAGSIRRECTSEAGREATVEANKAL